MDNISSIIQLQDTPPTYQQTNSQFPSNPLWQQIIPQDDFQHYYHQLPSQDHGVNADRDLSMSGDKSTHEEFRFKRSKSSSCIEFRSSAKEEENSSGDHNQPCKRTKILHRDIERQRRQDMASLYTSLRSLLPLQYLKGKRSISDHIQEAVKYIKHVEEKIRKLSDERNELKRLCNVSSGLNYSSMEGSEMKDSVRVEACYVGVEVVINTCCMRQQEFPLSRVIAILSEEGLSVVSCISTKVNQRMLHSIISEVSEARHIDMSEMQEKLNKLVIKRFSD